VKAHGGSAYPPRAEKGPIRRQCSLPDECTQTFLRLSAIAHQRVRGCDVVARYLAEAVGATTLSCKCAHTAAGRVALDLSSDNCLHYQYAPSTLFLMVLGVVAVVCTAHPLSLAMSR